MGSDQSSIRECAYYRWQHAGQPLGEDLKFWLEAEQELQAGMQRMRTDDELVEEASEESFPASDPPAGVVSKVGSPSRKPK